MLRGLHPREGTGPQASGDLLFGFDEPGSVFFYVGNFVNLQGLLRGPSERDLNLRIGAPRGQKRTGDTV